MRRLRYCVASSLDGFIAGPNGEYDWIVPDPSIDFAALFSEFDAFVMGRKTFEVVRSQGAGGMYDGGEVLVASRTLRQEDCPGVTVVGEGVEQAVAALKEKPGKDVWLFGGGELFRSLLDAGLVDTVEVGLIPVLLGGGIPLVAPGARSPELKLVSSKALPSGTVMLVYAVGLSGAGPGR
jgi:dihydrofolate reductase